MYYHSLMLFTNKMKIAIYNMTSDELVSKIVVPFVNGQVIDRMGYHTKTIYNLKTAVSLTILGSDAQEKKVGRLDDMLFFKNINNKYRDCTDEVINLARQFQSSHGVRSLLQNSLVVSDENYVFVIMKYGDKHLDSAYKGVIRPICDKYGLKASRADEIQDSNKITDQIVENISKSRYVIADLTGERPNCYYEVGLAHALGKELILSIKKTSEKHFDLQGYRFIEWETETELREALDERMASLMKQRSA